MVTEITILDTDVRGGASPRVMSILGIFGCYTKRYCCFCKNVTVQSRKQNNVENVNEDIVEENLYSR